MTIVPRPHANVANYDFEIFKTELEEKWSVKAAQIAVADIIRKGIKNGDTFADPTSNSQENQTYFQGLIANVVENIVINVKNVHIRYEDRVSSVETPFSIGVVFRDIAIYTTNSEGQKIFFDADLQSEQAQNHLSINKRAHVKSFSIYWSADKDFKSLSSLSTSQWRTAMQEIFRTDSTNAQRKAEKFLLSPMDTFIRFVHYKSRSPRYPSAYEIHANLDRLKMNISMSQYSNLLAIFQNKKQRQMLRKGFFASVSRMQKARFKTDLKSMHSRYVDLYSMSISGQIKKNLGEELTHLERDMLDVNTIMELRDKAERSQDINEKEDVSGFGISSFIDVLFGTDVEDEQIASRTMARSEAERGNKTSSGRNDNPGMPYFKVGMSLYNATVKLFDDSSSYEQTNVVSNNWGAFLAQGMFGGEMQFVLHSYPRTSGTTLWALQMELLTFEIISGKPEHGKLLFFETTKSKGESRSTQPLLYVSVSSESNKTHSTVDTELKVAPLTVCYNFEFFNRVHDLRKDILRNADVEKVAKETLENLQAWAEQGIAEIIANRQVLRAKIQILSPKVIFPLAANHNVVMNLGYVKATYGNSADAPSLKLINLSIGHLEIDDSPYIGTKFHKLATSNSTDSDDLIYTVCTVDYMEQHVSIGIKFEELALQWNPDTINALLNQFFQSSEDGTARGKVVRENVYEDGSIEVEPVEESSVTQVTNDWNTKVDVKMKELSLTLNKEKIGRAVARFQMIDTIITYSSGKNGEYRVVGSLGNIRGVDLCTKRSKHQCILQLQDTEKNSLLEFLYVSGEIPKQSSDVLDSAGVTINSELELGLSSVRIVYVHSFYMELIDYFWQAVMFSSPIPDDLRAMDFQLLHGAENTIVSAMQFMCRCKSINLLIPVNPEETPVVVLYVPTLNILSEYGRCPLPFHISAKTGGASKIVATRQLHISAEEVKLYNDEESICLDNFTFNATVVQPLLDAFVIEKLDDRALHIYLESRIPKLKGKLTKSGYLLLTRMLYENFGSVEEIFSPGDISEMSNAGSRIVQYYYGQTDIVSPFFQHYCFNIDFVSLSLVDNSKEDDRIVGLFLLENAKYTYKILKCSQSSLFHTGTVQTLNCWPYTVVNMLQFFNLSAETEEQDKETDQTTQLVSKEPFLIFNLLPCRLFIEFKLKGKNYEQITLGVGDTAPFHRFDADIYVRVDGCTWSLPMKYELGKEFSCKLKIITSVDQTIDLNIKMMSDKIDIAANFWAVNHTRLELQFKNYEKSVPCAVVPPPSLDSISHSGEPKMLSKHQGSQLQVRVNGRNSRWSQPCDCERSGTHDAIEWNYVSDVAEVHDIFFSVDSGPFASRLGLTRIIHFHPKYLILNKTEEDIFFCQRGTQQKTLCLPNDPTPFYFTKGHNRSYASSSQNEFICFSKSGNKWSKGVRVHRPRIFIVEDMKVTVDWRGARQLLICVSKASEKNRLEHIDTGNPVSPSREHDGWESVANPASFPDQGKSLGDKVSTLDSFKTEFSCKKMQVHFLNATEKFLSLTLTDTFAVSQQAGENVKYRCSLGMLSSVQKIRGKKHSIFVSDPSRPFLRMKINCVIAAGYTSHIKMFSVQLSPVAIDTDEHFFRYIQHYFMRPKDKNTRKYRLDLYVEDLQNFQHDGGHAGRSFIEHIEISKIKIYLSFRRSYDAQLDHQLAKVGGIPLTDILGIKTNFQLLKAPIKVNNLSIFELEGSTDAINSYLMSVVSNRITKSFSLPMLLAHSDAVENFVGDLVKDKVSNLFDGISKFVLPEPEPQFITFTVQISGKGKLGVEVRPKYSENLGAIVHAVKDGGLLGRQHGVLHVGDHMTGLNSVNVRKLPFMAIVKMLQSRGEGEMIIEFTRMNENK